MIRALCRLALCLLALAPTLARAQDGAVFASPKLAAFEYGILCYYNDTNPGVPLTPDQVPIQGGVFDEITAHGSLDVPAIAGLTFGVLSAFPDGVSHEVRSVLTHTTTNGQVFEDFFTYTIGDTSEVDGWRIQGVDPDTPGTYRFLGQIGSDVIYDLTFRVVDPSQYAGFYPDCVQRP